MEQIFSKVLKAALVLTVVLFVVFLIFGIVLILDWPWWVGFFILVGLVGLWVGVLFFRKIWLSRREQRFVQQIIEQDEFSLKTMSDKDKDQLQALQDRWKEAMEALRRSHVKQYGNPLYVLPWYLIIGESGSGKTTAIQSARLSSPFAEISKTSGISGTRNCDWWFFEQAIIIDTAGRYAVPVDEGKDKEEWQKFLALLAKYRKREPLNGLVITIAADRLLEEAPSVLEEDGRGIRRRIDELMRVLGAKFPVYVLVTKCDLIQGMTQFCNSLPEKNLDQAMGGINHDLSSEVTLFQDRVIQTIGKRLRDFRLLLLHKSESKVVDPGLLLFPEEFERLNPGLAAFIKGAFQENPYQETPMLRGLFVSSGRQEGSPYSHFLNALGLIEDKEVLPGTNKGLFLHDFFARIMPKDRGLFAPTLRALEWNRLTRNLGLTAWVALVIALCGLLSFSFVKNLRTMREVSHEFTKPPVLQGDTITDVMIMDRFYRAILKVEERNRRWLIPRFGLRESRNVEVQLKNKYCTVFKGGFLVSRDEKMAEKMADFSASTPQEVIGQHVVHLVRRINLLKTRLEGEELEVLHAKPHPSYDPLVLQTGEKLIPEIRQKIGTLYLSYLVWRSDPASLNIEMNDLQMWLKHILALKGTNLNWLITWVNENPSLSSLSFEDFWGGSLSASHEATVMPAFTRKGKEELDSFLNETESALPDPLLIASKKLEFQEWYHHAYIGAWYDFGTSFSEGMNRLKGREEWQRMAVTMATKQEPYFTLIDRMVEELEPFIKNKTLPPWIKLVYAFHDIKLQADREAALKEKSTLAKATDTGRKLFTQMGKEEAFEAQLVAAKALQEYRKVLAEILPATASQIVAYQMASQAYNEDPTTSKSPFFIAQSAVSNLKSNMSHIGADQQMFWEIVSGPLLYLWTFVRIETGCRLQDIWEKQVLLEVEGIGNQKNLTQLLLGQDGYAMKFIEGHAAPFMSRSLRKKGYYAKQVLGGKIPFEDSFLSFLTKGTRAVQPIKARYAVTIRGLPIDTNSDAQIRPHATRLEVRCSGETQTLVNLNYPVVKTFDWSPQTCDDVTFQIEVGNLVLTRKYKGYQAFPRFLKDFSGGQRTFYPGAFPSKKAALKRLGIKYIKAKYRFKGHEPVLKLLFAVPGKVPSNIVRCWDR